ncbi:threonine--tRNA ligase [Actinocatenispora comari]|uniref:Threonine--tRNA ligase n=1 Tax=Actinocatenispora comari TaxID=2807577 RepID=A0A8J4AH86_9ACTN|nr:threonine--tRNA ligase [Actinocatenispora comari]GIL29495.1 threonine--tRNA ligase [Actinocatenispora comari]
MSIDPQPPALAADDAARPDHRRLGRELDLFATDPLVGSGLPLWLPDGAIVRYELEKLAAESAAADGCRRVYTPVLAKRELYERSGHWAKFADDMFPPMLLGGEEFVLRPANCPHHALVYASRQRSVRDLPLRLSELASMFRSELSGVLSGLSRVRQINLDDIHVFCAPDQVGDEIVLALQAIQRVHGKLGVEVAGYRLSRRGSGGNYLGDAALWSAAEDQLAAALDRLGLSYQDAEGEAAFYGPKIDVQVVDPSGREESLATVQLDFNQPERFDLQYVGHDGARHRPVMIHRGTLGAMERLVAYLLERHDGALPTWLSPVQVAVLPVGADQVPAAERLLDTLQDNGIRVELAGPQDSLGARVARARQRRVPYQAVVGAREAVADAATVRTRDGARRLLGTADLVAELRAHITARD